MLSFILLCITAIITALVASFCVHKLFHTTIPIIRYSITGNTKGKPIVFIHGWPDTSSVWKKQIEYFQDKHLCINIKLPNFDQYNIQNPWGYPAQIVSKGIATQIQNILQDKYPQFQKEGVILMLHDWGSIIGQLIIKEYEHLVNKAVIIDIGNGIPSRNVKSILMVMSYQLFNVFCFLLPKAFGDLLMRSYCYQMSNKNMQFPAVEEEKRSGKKILHFGMNYLYFHSIKELFWRCGKVESLTLNVPKCPTFFAAGKWILQPWHTRKWKKVLMERKDCVYKKYENARHWVMCDQADTFNKDISDWLAKF